MSNILRNRKSTFNPKLDLKEIKENNLKNFKLDKIEEENNIKNIKEIHIENFVFKEDCNMNNNSKENFFENKWNEFRNKFEIIKKDIETIDDDDNKNPLKKLSDFHNHFNSLINYENFYEKENNFKSSNFNQLPEIISKNIENNIVEELDNNKSLNINLNISKKNEIDVLIENKLDFIEKQLDDIENIVGIDNKNFSDNYILKETSISEKLNSIREYLEYWDKNNIIKKYESDINYTIDQFNTLKWKKEGTENILIKKLDNEINHNKILQLNEFILSIGSVSKLNKTINLYNDNLKIIKDNYKKLEDIDFENNLNELKETLEKTKKDYTELKADIIKNFDEVIKKLN